MKKRLLNWNILSEYKSELYGLTILWIMFFHSYLCGVYFFREAAFPLKLVHTFVNHGNMGCDIFLFLSGIFAYYSFSRRPDYFAYEKKRYIRLWMPAAIINGIYWLILFFKDFNFVNLITRFTLIKFWYSGDQQIWFISFILLCYLVYPFIFLMIYREDNSLNVFNWVCLILYTVVLLYLFQRVSPELYNRYEIALTRLPVFLLGCGAGEACKNKKEMSVGIIPACIGAVIITMYLFYTNSCTGVYKRYIYIGGIAYLLLAAFLLKLIQSEQLNRFLRFFGDRSLHLYLAHIFLRRMYAASPLYVEGSKIRYILMLLLSVLLASLAEKIESFIHSKSGRKTKKKRKHNRNKHSRKIE